MSTTPVGKYNFRCMFRGLRSRRDSGKAPIEFSRVGWKPDKNARRLVDLRIWTHGKHARLLGKPSKITRKQAEKQAKKTFLRIFLIFFYYFLNKSTKHNRKKRRWTSHFVNSYYNNYTHRLIPKLGGYWQGKARWYMMIPQWMKAFHDVERTVPQASSHSVSFSQSFSARKTPPKQKAFCAPFV